MPTDARAGARSTDLRIEKLTQAGIALLQEERDLALKGDLPALAALAPRKEAFLETMEALAEQLASVRDHGGLARQVADQQARIAGLLEIVQRRAEENQYLLEAALSGVKSAEKQISILEKASLLVGVYDNSGKPVENQEIAGKQGSIY